MEEVKATDSMKFENEPLKQLSHEECLKIFETIQEEFICDICHDTLFDPVQCV